MKTPLRPLFAVLLAVATFALSSCAVPLRAPESVRHVSIAKIDSTSLIVDKAWFDDRDGMLTLRGYVLLRLAAPQETSGKIEIAFRRTDGTVNKTYTAPIEAWRQQPKLRTKIAAFSCIVGTLPPETASVEIKAVEQ